MTETFAFEPEAELTQTTLRAAVDTVSRHFGPGARNWPSQIALSCANYRNLYRLPPTIVRPRFDVRAIDVLGIRVIESSVLTDDEIVLMYGTGLDTRIKLIRLKEEPSEIQASQDSGKD